MHARRGYPEVCHLGTSVGSATQGRLGWDKGAGQGHPVQLKVKEALHIERTPLTADSIVTGAMSYHAILDRYHEEAREGPLFQH